ncbi:MAG TPA: FixH family protein [Polyangia bacterium]|nr:FixH family protein [Polyangia bacterium]
MIRISPWRCRVCAVLLALLAWAAPPRASGNKEPGAASPAPPAAPTRLLSTTATGELYRLLLKYEPVPAGEPTAFTVSVHDLRSGAPVLGAAVELRLVNAHAELRSPLPPAAGPGDYTATVTFPVDGDYEAIAKVTRDGEIDLVRFEPVRVGALPGTAAGAAHARQQRLLFGAVVLFILAMLTVSFVSYRRSSRPGAPPPPPET